MDPEACLAEIRDIYREMENTSMRAESAASRGWRLAYLIRSLDNWLSSGGFPPSDWEQTP